MPNDLHALRLRQTDDSLEPWRSLPSGNPPAGGWVRTIRQALGMSVAHLAGRLGLSRQAVTTLEQREVHRTVTLAMLDRVAAALDAEVVYAIVPRTSLEESRRARARVKAEAQLGRVAHSMRLEAQGVSEEEYQRQLDEVSDRLLREWSRTLWSDDTPSPGAP